MMQKIIDSLTFCKFIDSYEILEYFNEDTTKLIKIKAKLNNSTTLYIRELIQPDNCKYSYHWQNENNEMILRWDNAPHFPSVSTFPHHLHRGNEVTSSYRVFIEEVLSEIKNYLYSESKLGAG
ncbi:hypothetical protein H8E88_13360 [candidate division KSB1 bacterium]|nr:hypothetical protein [candidate division KSB1 bacterium]MBL7094408.1 hypothetical protein [candidate division KSB1 bacterium]